MGEIIGSIALDGVDKAGKKTASLAVLERLLDTKIISIGDDFYKDKEWGIIYSDFPQYFTPSGFLVRNMNRGGSKEFIGFLNRAEGVVNFEDELHIRMAMYAMDRIFSWIMINEQLQFSDKKYIHLSDRSVYSNIVTIAYLLQQYKMDNRLEEFYGRLVDADTYLSQAWDWNLVVLKAPSKDGTFGNRKGEGDEIEGIENQPLIEKAFDLLIEDSRFGNRVVYSKYENGIWKPKDKIAWEILDSVGINIVSNRIQPDSYENVFDKMRGLPDLVSFVSPKRIVRILFPHYKLGDSNRDPLNKSLDDLEIQWRVANLSSDSIFERYFGKQERKEVLEKVEAKCARFLSVIMAEAYVKDSYIKKLPAEIIQAGRYLCNEFTGGRLLSFIRFLESRSRMRPGFSRFVSQVFDVK